MQDKILELMQDVLGKIKSSTNAFNTNYYLRVMKDLCEAYEETLEINIYHGQTKK